MDTKWKNRAAMIVWLILFTYGVSGVFAALVNDREYTKQSYFKTIQFEERVSQLIEYIQAFEVSYQPKEEMKKSITITNEEVEEYRYQYGDLAEQITSIEQQYEENIQNAQDSNDKNIMDIYRNERDTKIKDITKNFESDEYVKEKILKEKEQQIDEYYKDLETHREDYLTYQKVFTYYLKNISTDEIYTNLPSEESQSVDKYINNKTMAFIRSYPMGNHNYLNMWEHQFSLSNDEFITDSNALYEGKISISKDAPKSNYIMGEYYEYQEQRKLFWIFTIGAVIALVVSVLIGKKIRIVNRIASSKWKAYYDRIPFDVALIPFGVTAVISLFLMLDIYDYSMLREMINLFILLILFFGVTVIQGILMYPRLISLFTNKEIWKTLLIAQFVKIIRDAFLNRKVGTQVFIILTLVFLFGVGTILIIIEPLFLLLYVPAFFIVVVPLFFLIVKRTGYFNEIIKNTHALANGHFEPDLKIVGKSVFAKLAEDINRMKQGVKVSQKAQAKSERLKTELITNVSHDLRTPLTSIITYSELLKNPELTEDERSTYLEVIDRKSKRLKVLIDDLFEASKMASGNIELIKVKVDIVQLLQQALAEYNETIQDSTIQFRVINPDQPVYAIVDGQKLWRVFDNLIGNILKYSLENTRAYINVKVEKEHVMITFKNISKYELNDDVDELFDRFKRGDESRNTDGSGLGLAIAKSIIDLHEGALDIDVDGDLFKVTLKLELPNR
ncbi:histidine kinase dimerization/phospho-acceptor domain-containing protein [Metabacillus litoralis]|uniref:histidine kinase dimerization/phospho-acceptor domain-containing protein n=1 Tax=Metabacillus litoralis TaxID=152268 RepID=UPI00203CDDC7|nr:histidine kinase dimerization/phospho-acceptor domain-containing protein [Metabacillus litoralis]MCM3652555.1 ATP-binding protein [Metabacillus litoralis]